jgi:hypothetical protein
MPILLSAKIKSQKKGQRNISPFPKRAKDTNAGSETNQGFYRNRNNTDQACHGCNRNWNPTQHACVFLYHRQFEMQ